MSDLKRAMLGAHKRGMKLVPRTDQIADIFCATCGWPKTHRETVIVKYANEPYDCLFCTWSKEYGRPCPGHAQPQENAQ